MKVSNIGNNLNILITCSYAPHYDWMTFLCWYSLTKNLPDAKIYIACNRNQIKQQWFSWINKCKIPFILHKVMSPEDQIEYAIHDKKIDLPILIVPAEYICIKEFDDNFAFEGKQQLEQAKDLFGNCKNENIYSFVEYKSGWGKFNTDAWINKPDCPFMTNLKYISGDMTANEIRIGQLWSKAASLYKGLL